MAVCLERITISLSDELAGEIETFAANNHYDNRSEAIRDLTAIGLKQHIIETTVSGQCVATLSYVFDHHARDLAKRLTEAHHHPHDLQIATMHVHLDHDNCLEVVVLRGEAVVVKDYAGTIIAERGVRHGNISFVPVNVSNETHRHVHEQSKGRAHLHLHAHPKT